MSRIKTAVPVDRVCEIQLDGWQAFADCPAASLASAVKRAQDRSHAAPEGEGDNPLIGVVELHPNFVTGEFDANDGLTYLDPFSVNAIRPLSQSTIDELRSAEARWSPDQSEACAPECAESCAPEPDPVVNTGCSDPFSTLRRGIRATINGHEITLGEGDEVVTDPSSHNSVRVHHPTDSGSSTTHYFTAGYTDVLRAA